MKLEDYLTLAGLIITIGLNIITLNSSSKLNKKIAFVDSITKERITSMNDLKNNVAKFRAELKQIKYGFLDESEFKQVIKELTYLENKITFQLNPLNSNEEELHNLVMKLSSLARIRYFELYSKTELMVNIKMILSSGKEYFYDDLLEYFNRPDSYIEINSLERLIKDLTILFESNLIQFERITRIHLKSEWDKAKSETK